MATGVKNLKTVIPAVGRLIQITHGPMTEATATLDGQRIAWICPPGRKFAVRRAGFYVGTRATTGTTYLNIEKLASGDSVGSGTNLNGGADASGAGVDDNGSLAAANSFAPLSIDDEEGANGVNVVSAGDSFAIETNGDLTGLAGVFAFLELEELPA